jgi:hypothetical protein
LNFGAANRQQGRLKTDLVGIAGMMQATGGLTVVAELIMDRLARRTERPSSRLNPPSASCPNTPSARTNSVSSAATGCGPARRHPTFIMIMDFRGPWGAGLLVCSRGV